MPEINFPENLNWLESRTILKCRTGSLAYGTATETSDTDYRAIVIPPAEYLLGIPSFTDYNTAGGKTFINTKDDVDYTATSLAKFVQQAMTGVPNNIELLFMAPEDVLFCNDYGRVLLDNRHLFLSQRCQHRMCAYAHAQRQRLEASLNNPCVGRQALVEQHGYDTKLAYHALRLLYGAHEILTTGDFHTRRPVKEQLELLQVRRGEIPYAEFFGMYNAMSAIVEHLIPTNKIVVPKEPDYHKINNLLINMQRVALDWEGN
jgi:predicted nucleotidyltransferase